MDISGLLIRRERLRRDWSPEGGCRGICAVSYLSKVEQGKAQASEEVLRALFERLDIPWELDEADAAALAECRERLRMGDDGGFHARFDALRPRTEALRRTLGAVPVTVMCDIDNPLCGPEGAAAVFGPQKGADAAMMARLDAGLYHLAQVLARDLGAEVLTLPGGGAAGGFGAGAAAFFGGTLRMGIDTVLDTADFDRRCRGARLVITGEGHLDSQSLRGKTVIGVARRARALGIPAAALVGGCETALDAVYAAGVSGVFPINPAPCTLAEARQHSEKNLRFTVENLLRFMAALEK